MTAIWIINLYYKNRWSRSVLLAILNFFDLGENNVYSSEHCGFEWEYYSKIEKSLC